MNEAFNERVTIDRPVGVTIRVDDLDLIKAFGLTYIELQCLRPLLVMDIVRARDFLPLRLRQYIYTLRRKLGKHDITILYCGSHNYTISISDKKKIVTILESYS